MDKKIPLNNVLSIIDDVEAMYPEWLFPNTPENGPAIMARLTCQNIRREITECLADKDEEDD